MNLEGMSIRNRYREGAEKAAQRSNIYSLLALIYRKEVTREFLRLLKESDLLSGLMELGAAFDDDFLHCPDSQLVEDLAAEYTRLFIGPGPHLSPHESVYHERTDGDWGTLWGADTVAVKKFIETSGMKYRRDYRGLPDDISVELEFMKELTDKESQAWEETDEKGALYCLKMERKFLDEHVLQWMPAFCDKVMEHAAHSFYREIARITKNFIDIEKDHFQSS